MGKYQRPSSSKISYAESKINKGGGGQEAREVKNKMRLLKVSIHGDESSPEDLYFISHKKLNMYTFFANWPIYIFFIHAYLIH